MFKNVWLGVNQDYGLALFSDKKDVTFHIQIRGYNQGENTPHLCTRENWLILFATRSLLLAEESQGMDCPGGWLTGGFYSRRSSKKDPQTPGFLLMFFFCLFGGFSCWWSVVFLFLFLFFRFIQLLTKQPLYVMAIWLYQRKVSSSWVFRRSAVNLQKFNGKSPCSRIVFLSHHGFQGRLLLNFGGHEPSLSPLILNYKIWI